MAQKKIILWCIPRTRSTAFELSMASVPSFKVFHEEHTLAEVMGEDRVPGPYSNFPILPNYSFKDVKKRLEADHPGKEVIFAKDMVSCAPVQGSYNSLPDGYQSTFLIRHPKETYPSFYKLNTSSKEKGLLQTDAIELTLTYGSFQPMYDLYNYLTKEKGQQPVVIDSNDLIQNPRDLLQRYCKIMGIPFYESMLNWQPGNIGHWHELLSGPYFSFVYKSAIESSGFFPPKPKTVTVPPSGEENDDMPQAIKEAIEKDTVIFEGVIKNKM
ncbi:uncharacterized protein LOC144446884 [Glandiceps talaboti]